MKTISKGLMILLAIQIAILLPFESIWLQPTEKKAKAEDPGNVPVADPVLNFRLTGTSYNTITISASYGAGTEPREFVFDSPSSIKASENFLGADHVPRYNRRTDDTDDIKSYKLNRPTLNCQSGAESRLIYLITVKYRDDQENKVRFSGIYVAYESPTSTGETTATKKYQHLPNGAFVNGGWCHNLQENQPDDASIIKLANSTFVNTPIVPQLSVGQRQQTCNEIQSNWEQLKQDVRDLFNPAPGSTGQSQNENWIVTGGMWNAAAWWAASRETADAFCDWVESAVGLPPDQGEALIAIRQQKLAPSGTGIHRFKSIMERGKKLGEDVDAILASDDPTCSDIQLKVFKWNKNLEGETYPDLNSFKTAIGELLQTSRLFFETYQEPVVTAGTEDICGSGMGILGGKIFQWLFCELANIIHGIAASIMTRATEWLTDSIGVDINIKFKDPEKDEVPTGGGGADTPALGTENPSPAPGTAAPMNISGTLRFQTEDEYNRAKGDGGIITVKVKNNNAAGAIINVSPTISWGTWGSTRGRVSCRFTTTENIPAEWTSVKIYSEDASGNLRFRFSINYPPAGNTFTAISSIE